MAPKPDWEALFTAANEAKTHAYAPYSKFPVGAAILLGDGRVVTGCNVENASYGLSLCAERNAVGTIVLAGKGKPDFVAVAIVADSDQPCPPCGMCRQVLAEFAGPKLPVHCRTAKGKELKTTMGELLPHAFGPGFL